MLHGFALDSGVHRAQHFVPVCQVDERRGGAARSRSPLIRTTSGQL